MIEESHFKTFLYISKNKYQIFVYDKNNLKNIYNEEIRIDDEIDFIIFQNFLMKIFIKLKKR